MKRWALLHYVVPSTIVLVLGLLLLFGLDRQAHENQERINYSVLDADTYSIATLLESSIARRLSVVDALRAFISVNPNVSEADFRAFATELAENTPSINSLHYTDRDTLAIYSYQSGRSRPQSGPLLEGPKSDAQIASSINSGGVNIEGPVYRNGSLELVAFAPVGAEMHFLGLAVAVFDVPNLLAVSLPTTVADPSAQTRPIYEFRVLDSDGNEFYGAHSTQGQIATRQLQVGDGIWHVEMAWRDEPPRTPPGTLSLIWGLGGIGLLAALGWINREQLSLLRQSRLARENARLLADSNHLLQQTQALQAIMTDVTARRTVEDVLNAIADQVAQVFGAGHVGLFVLEHGGQKLQWNITRKLDPELNAAIAERYNEAGSTGRIDQGKPITVADVAAATGLGPLRDQMLAAGIKAVLVVPLRREGSVVGALVLYHDSVQEFGDQTCALAQTFADQAAIALENAHLLLEAHGKAALEERQRLARELHDSVSQALYGISLGARTGRTLLERDPVAAAEAMDYVVTLAKAGLAEMRALIFELRPESLQNEGLVVALDKQAASLRARYNIGVDTTFGPEPAVPVAVKEALNRIAQEALHNIVKHAKASNVELGLAPVGGMVVLSVRDNGGGFDVKGDYPGHLGMHSMRERMAQLGGTLEVESTPGAGTLIRAKVPLAVPVSSEAEKVPAQV